MNVVNEMVRYNFSISCNDCTHLLADGIGIVMKIKTPSFFLAILSVSLLLIPFLLS